MKILTNQQWELKNGEDDEKIFIEFTRYDSGSVDMNIHKGKNLVVFEGKQIEELKEILDYTKFIFKQ